MELITAKAHIIGVAPLLMHNVRLLDPLNPFTKRLSEITSKRKKTEADLIELRWREYEGGIYADEKGPYVPSEWVESVIRDGAKIVRRGKDITAAMYCTEDRFHLEGFPKAKSVRALYEAGHSDYRPVVVTGKKVMRSRPRFNTWELHFAVTFNDAVLNPDVVEEAIQNAGLLKGLGDYRPKYGRFKLEKFEVVK